MWCEQCQSDVATEISADGQQLLCTACHQPVRKVIAPSLHPETRSAREFLERWAREQQGLKASQGKSADPAADVPGKNKQAELADPFVEPSIPADDVADSESRETPPEEESGPGAPETPAPASPKKYRIDSQHSAPAGPLPPRQYRPRRPHHLENINEPVASPPESEIPATPTAVTPPSQVPPKSAAPSAPGSDPHYRIDAAQPSARGPHFDINALAPQRTAFPGRNEAIWGQLLAYAGVGLLTVGTIFVLWGYFGEIEQYASTGWLIATAGQMLLLLGIVTLVGGGMQQTTHEVTQRIEHLGGRIIRIEESTDKILQAPYFRRPRRRSRKNPAGDQEAA